MAIELIIYIIGLILTVVIRQPHAMRQDSVNSLLKTGQSTEKIIVTAASFGMLFLPVIYILSGFPEEFDYKPASWQKWVGSIVFLVSLWLLYRSHADLGKQWSATLELRESHSLITQGVYTSVRHPMYTSHFLWVIAQAILIPNFFIGFIGLIGFSVLFFVRVPQEERMMASNFGEEYKKYAAQTKRIIPFIY